jgi:hypothetical protein
LQPTLRVFVAAKRRAEDAAAGAAALPADAEVAAMVAQLDAMGQALPPAAAAGRAKRRKGGRGPPEL